MSKQQFLWLACNSSVLVADKDNCHSTRTLQSTSSLSLERTKVNTGVSTSNFCDAHVSSSKSCMTVIQRSCVQEHSPEGTQEEVTAPPPAWVMHLLPPAPPGFNNHTELVFAAGAASPFSPPSKGHEALLWCSLPKAFQDPWLKATPLLHLTQPLPSQSTPNFTAVYLQPACVQSLRRHSLLHQTNTTKHVWQTPPVLRPEHSHVSVQFKKEKQGLNILQ